MTEGFYTHKKTGKLYLVIFSVLNCTNSNDGQKMIVYREARLKTRKEDRYFVREEKEFLEKFERTE